MSDVATFHDRPIAAGPARKDRAARAVLAVLHGCSLDAASWVLCFMWLRRAERDDRSVSGDAGSAIGRDPPLPRC